MNQNSMPSLKDDINAGDLLRFVGFDFETLTPTGRPPEPIELGALMLGSKLAKINEYKFQEFIKPPSEVYFTKFDTDQTGIRPENVAKSPNASSVLQKFDASVSPFACIFIAQNAKYDHSILFRYPDSAVYALTRPFLDTVKIARYLFPNLPNYKLDTLAQLTEVNIPAGRHRALVDVQITLDVFIKLVDVAISKGILSISDLIEVGKITDWGTPKQMNLF